MDSSSTLKVASTVVNALMSANGTGPFANTLVVNEFLDRAAAAITGTMPARGDMNASLLLDQRINVTTPLSAGEMTIKTISLTGLDTMNAFDVLKIPDLRTNYTLTNRLGMDHLAFGASANISLGPGTCVKRGSVGIIDFDFDVELAVEKLAVSIATALLVDPAKMGSTQIGQLLAEGLTSIVGCALPSM